MKKVISLLLVVVFVCSAFVGCGWINDVIHGGKEPQCKLPEGVIETNVTDENGNLLTVAHSDNFTQDDIEFITLFHNKIWRNQATWPVLLNLSDVIRLTQYSGSGLFLMHFENPYIIVAYLKPNQTEYVKDEHGDYRCDITKYVWYRFETTQSVPQKLDNMELSQHYYILYDCTVVRDIVSGVEYNKECKYYVEYINESSLNNTTTDMIMYFYGENDEHIYGSDTKFIKESEVTTTRYRVYTDEAGLQYLVLLDEQYDSDTGLGYPLADRYLEEYYDYLYPYFVRNEFLDVKITGIEGNYTINRYKQIELDLFVDLLFGEE